MRQINSKSDAYSVLTEQFNYPENVARDMCNYYSTSDLIDYVEFLETEYEQ